MTTKVPTTSTTMPADLKGPAGGGLSAKPTEAEAVSLSPALKAEVRKIVEKFTGGNSSFTEDEFQKFLRDVQNTSTVPFEGKVTADQLETYLLSPANDAVQVMEIDLSHPMKDYLISSSHNTYLVGHQLYGDASTEGYKTVLQKGCRCIEIDCWDGENNEPKVVHGFTAVDPITFRVVCQAIAKYAFVATDLPLIISLEVHCSIEQQKKLVQILHEEFGELLLTKRVEGHDLDTLPSPLQLKNKILLKSKYLPPDNEVIPPSQTSESSSESEPEHDTKSKKPKKPKIKILRSLSDLGIYTTSTHYHNYTHPHCKLFNHIHSFSERAYKKLFETDPKALCFHNSNYLTRVYPFGLRFSSSNQEPAVFWRTGAQLVALNWQKFDLGMQQNDALFSSSGGMVLKLKPKGYVTLTIDILGACGLPCPNELKDISKLDPYVKVEVRGMETFKKQTRTEKDSGANVIWNSSLRFPKVLDDLVFVRFLLYDDGIGRDGLFASFTARLDCLQTGYRVLRLLDVEGRQVPGALLMIRVHKM